MRQRVGFPSSSARRLRHPEQATRRPPIRRTRPWCRSAQGLGLAPVQALGPGREQGLRPAPELELELEHPASPPSYRPRREQGRLPAPLRAFPGPARQLTHG